MNDTLLDFADRDSVAGSQIASVDTSSEILPVLAPLSHHLNVEKLSDFELFQKCNQYGLQARMWRDRFLGLLPEVARRELFRVKGFESIFVFAFKLGGVSQAQVERVLGMERNLRGVPVLHQMLVSGEVSANKLARVAGVATVENQVELAAQVKILPREALETLARDMKEYNRILTHGAEDADISKQNTNTSMQLSFVHVHGLASSEPVDSELPNSPLGPPGPLGSLGERFALTEEAEQKLQELYDKGIDISEFILQAAQEREEQIQEDVDKLGEECETKKANSRHIPKKIRELLKKKYGTKCAIAHCRKPSQEIHHTARYALSKSHNPLFLAPLCSSHHKIAHTIDLNVQENRKR